MREYLNMGGRPEVLVGLSSESWKMLVKNYNAYFFHDYTFWQSYHEHGQGD